MGGYLRTVVGNLFFFSRCQNILVQWVRKAIKKKLPHWFSFELVGDCQNLYFFFLLLHNSHHILWRYTKREENRVLQAGILFQFFVVFFKNFFWRSLSRYMMQLFLRLEWKDNVLYPCKHPRLSRELRKTCCFLHKSPSTN